MSYNYTLKYKSFNSLLDEIMVDFRNLAQENLIEPATLIKGAKRVNYDLGLRIMMTSETLLDAEKGRIKLPDNFFVLNYALLCDEQELVQSMPQGTHIEERQRPDITPYKETQSEIDLCEPINVNCTKCSPDPCHCEHEHLNKICTKPRIEFNCKGNAYELVQVINAPII